MKLRTGLFFSPLILVLTLGCSESSTQTTTATPAKTETNTPEKVSKRRVKEPTKQLGPEGVVP